MDNCRLQFHWSLLRCILLLPLALAVPAEDSLMSNCPFNCQCSPNDGVRTGFTVSCQRRRTVVNNDQLSQQLDSLLSSNLTYSHLTSLGIINTPLTLVPRSICRLTTLTHLYLDNNQLIQLPDDCFPYLKHLTILSATRNKIQTLQNGLFDGLQELVSLTFSENHIYEIGLLVFSNESDMISLRHIDLSCNNLTSIEPWPLVRGKLGTENDTVAIRLDHNRISTFTNNISWMGHCSIKPVPFLLLLLRWNRIQRVMDIADAWNFSYFNTILCMHDRDRHSFRLFFDAKNFVRGCTYSHARIEMMFSFESLPKNCFCDNGVSDSWLDYFHHLLCPLTERCPSGCRCMYRPANTTLDVHCSNLSVFPLELPSLPKRNTKYRLDFSNNQFLRRLEHR